MYRRALSGKNAIVAMNRASGPRNEIFVPGAASSGQTLAGVTPARSLMMLELFQQVMTLSLSGRQSIVQQNSCLLFEYLCCVTQ